MKDFLTTGGITGMSIILILGILIVLASVAFIARRGMKLPIVPLDLKLWVSIAAFGGIALLFGVFYQTLGLYQAFDAIREAGDISPTMVMYGVFLSFYSTMFGLGMALLAFILWFFIRMAWINE